MVLHGVERGHQPARHIGESTHEQLDFGGCS
jgi:hypothetical protein